MEGCFKGNTVAYASEIDGSAMWAPREQHTLQYLDQVGYHPECRCHSIELLVDPALDAACPFHLVLCAPNRRCGGVRVARGSTLVFPTGLSIQRTRLKGYGESSLAGGGCPDLTLCGQVTAGSQWFAAGHHRSLREIASFRMKAFSVVRGIPRRAAAWLTTPPVSRSTRMTCSLSTCSSVLSPAGCERTGL